MSQEILASKNICLYLLITCLLMQLKSIFDVESIHSQDLNDSNSESSNSQYSGGKRERSKEREEVMIRQDGGALKQDVVGILKHSEQLETGVKPPANNKLQIPQSCQQDTAKQSLNKMSRLYNLYLQTIFFQTQDSKKLKQKLNKLTTYLLEKIHLSEELLQELIIKSIKTKYVLIPEQRFESIHRKRVATKEKLDQACQIARQNKDAILLISQPNDALKQHQELYFRKIQEIKDQVDSLLLSYNKINRPSYYEPSHSNSFNQSFSASFSQELEKVSMKLSHLSEPSLKQSSLISMNCSYQQSSSSDEEKIEPVIRNRQNNFVLNVSTSEVSTFYSSTLNDPSSLNDGFSDLIEADMTRQNQEPSGPYLQDSGQNMILHELDI